MTARRCSIQLLVWTAALPLLFVSNTPAAYAGSMNLKNAQADISAVTTTLAERLIENARAGDAHIITQFDAVPDSHEREALASNGVILLRYIGENAYFAAIDPTSATAAALTDAPGLTGCASISAEWKLHASLSNQRPPSWAVVEDAKDGVRRVAVCILFHPDVELYRGADLVLANDAVIVDQLQTLNALIIEVDEAALQTLAEADEVQWIEPPIPQLTPTNDQVREVTQADVVQASPYDLDGSGVTVLVYDGGRARETHLDFQGRLTALDSSPVSYHATHVAGTIGGGGVADPLYRGMAPGVTMVSYGLEGAGSEEPLYTNPGDLETDFAEAILTAGAVLSNTSLGSNVENNGYDCEWQGDYGSVDALIDGIVRGSFGEPFRAVWSAGNERPGYRCNIEGYEEYYSIAPPSGAKNHLTVGAVNSNDESMASFSSWGPTDDGRLKPDVCAPGCQVEGDHGVTSCDSRDDASYRSLCGTSMAAPAVCGLAALVLQDYQQLFPGQPLPRNSMLRALFAHTALDLGEIGPDYCFGYGSVRIVPAIETLRDASFYEAELNHGQTYSAAVDVAEGAPELKITLAWDDVPAVPNAEIALVNDLDLVVTDPNGTQYFPWTLNPLAPADPAVRTQPDRLNNIEQVLVENPACGQWTVSVVGYNVPQGPQPFSIVGDGAENITTVFAFHEEIPELIRPGVSYEFDVQIAAYGQALLPDSARLYYRVNGGEFSGLPLAGIGGDLYRATLPECECGDVPEYYLYVESSLTGPTTYPSDAPGSLMTHSIGSWTPLFTDDFEQAGDWTVIADAVSGNWELGDPEYVENLDVVTQPEDDHTPGAGSQCYVTGALAGYHASMYDLDGGPSVLISPVLDLTGRDALLSYWRWYHMTINMDDTFVIDITNDGVNWTTLEEVRRSFGEWRYAEWRVSDYVEPNASVQVRFTVNDSDPGSLIEALIDDFSVVELTCGLNIPGDLDFDGDVDLSDLAAMLAAYGACSGDPQYNLAADLDSSGCINLSDLAALLGVYGYGT